MTLYNISTGVQAGTWILCTKVKYWIQNNKDRALDFKYLRHHITYRGTNEAANLLTMQGVNSVYIWVFMQVVVFIFFALTSTLLIYSFRSVSSFKLLHHSYLLLKFTDTDPNTGGEGFFFWVGGWCKSIVHRISVCISAW